MNNSYEEIGHLSVTFPTDGCTVGKACTMNSYGLVRDCAEGEAVLGMTESRYGNQAAVQIGGFVEISYSGETPETGYKKMVADGIGGMKTDADGFRYWVMAVDRTKKTIIVKL